MPDISTKPYMLRAIYEWCTDSGYTPYLAVKVDASTTVPMEYVKKGEIILNISYGATSGLKMDNDASPSAPASAASRASSTSRCRTSWRSTPTKTARAWPSSQHHRRRSVRAGRRKQRPAPVPAGGGRRLFHQPLAEVPRGGVASPDDDTEPTQKGRPPDVDAN
jgi:stringent starvation protein B